MKSAKLTYKAIKPEDSPCTSKCKLNEKSICQGCGRTIQEIVGWTKFSKEQKIEINKRIKG